MRFDSKEFMAEKIRYHRKKMNLTQAELAEMIEISDQQISRIENACYIPSLSTFFKIVNVLKIDLKEFGFGGECLENSVKNELINKIRSADDIELLFYKNAIENLDTSLADFKGNYHIFKNF